MIALHEVADVALTIFYMALVPGALVLAFLPNIRAACTERHSDVTTIKARYEGLVGFAGPNMKVVSVKRAGTQLGGRYQPPARKYEVDLQRPDGSEFRETIGVTAGFFDDGNLVDVLGGARRSAKPFSRRL